MNPEKPTAYQNWIMREWGSWPRPTTRAGVAELIKLVGPPLPSRENLINDLRGVYWTGRKERKRKARAAG